ncbi:MAG: methyltransferase domain-containing protein [Anaerolineaceae bacterium]|nr:methyltransferase domain-containing protein [Anaerolineaceae bacterium]
MAESEQFWEMLWESRLQELRNLGKREAILGISRLIRRLTDSNPQRSLRLLELGCGEAQIIGPLVENHARVPGIENSLGVDYLPRSLAVCRRDYPRMKFLEGNFTDPDLLAGLGQFDIVLLVNALHEVFSAGYSPKLGEVDVPAAKAQVLQTLQHITGCMLPGGYLALFDGLEPPGDPNEHLRVRFLNPRARDLFRTFAREYRPFKIAYTSAGDPFTVELSRRHFTRYITKSIFLGKDLWKTERLESYQYFTESEFRQAFAQVGLKILELRTLTMNDEKWNNVVQIETPGAVFPTEHIWILAQLPAQGTAS